MTPDEMIAIINACKEGSIIERDSFDEHWIEVYSHTFNFANFRYRVKSTPREEVKLYKALVLSSDGYIEESIRYYDNLENAQKAFINIPVLRLMTEYPITMYKDELK